ncbi:hypothetical protein HNR40_010666 [Nonomuraea endophytica]|uniref:Uncharacterized protein n=1 Tax=Nonomuraea endophytica TaxID=714136 RepID=A0A7W8ENJ4_9ACTN|nr:hypothetical protein [Nonomuraea endophytica]
MGVPQAAAAALLIAATLTAPHSATPAYAIGSEARGVRHCLASAGAPADSPPYDIYGLTGAAQALWPRSPSSLTERHAYVDEGHDPF